MWCRDGTYHRTTRPIVHRLHQHSGGQPHSRPLGLWSREIRFLGPTGHAGLHTKPNSRSAHRGQ